MGFFRRHDRILISFDRGRGRRNSHTSQQEWPNQAVDIDPSVIFIKKAGCIFSKDMFEDFNPTWMISQIRADVINSSPQNYPTVVIFVVFSDFFLCNVPSQRSSFSLRQVFRTSQQQFPVMQSEARTSCSDVYGRFAFPIGISRRWHCTIIHVTI